MKCGAIFSGYDARDYKLVYTASAQKKFPQSFTLDMKNVRIKDQGNVGSCVAHSLSSIIEFYNYHQTHTDKQMSVGYIYGNRSTSDYKDEGMVMRDALEAVRKYGDVEYSLFPYNEEVPHVIDLFERQKRSLFNEGYPNRISQYCRVTDVNAIKSALMAGNPILMAMNWYDDMTVSENGILTTNYVGWSGGHCMFIYGWDETGWKVQNSWGPDWGHQGTMIVPYEMNIEEFWVVSDDIIEDTIVKKPFSSKAGKIVAKLFNKVNKIFNK